VKRLSLDKEVAGNGISITVPERRIFVEGSNHLTRVPGGYFSSLWGLLSWSRWQKRPLLYLMLAYTDAERQYGVDPETIWLIVLLISWVVDQKSV
jgi:hypothetical protein